MDGTCYKNTFFKVCKNNNSSTQIYKLKLQAIIIQTSVVEKRNFTWECLVAWGKKTNKQNIVVMANASLGFSQFHIDHNFKFKDFDSPNIN